MASPSQYAWCSHCWAPNPPGSESCHRCRARIEPAPRTLSGPETPNPAAPEQPEAPAPRPPLSEPVKILLALLAVSLILILILLGLGRLAAPSEGVSTPPPANWTPKK